MIDLPGTKVRSVFLFLIMRNGCRCSHPAVVLGSIVDEGYDRVLLDASERSAFHFVLCSILVRIQFIRKVLCCKMLILDVQRCILGLVFSIFLVTCIFNGVIDARPAHRPRFSGTHARMSKHRAGHRS